MKAGVIPVQAKGDVWTLGASRPRWREVDEPRAAIAEALGLDATDIVDKPLWVSTGNEQLIVPVASAEAVRRARPRPEALARLKCEDGQPKAYVFADAGDAAGTVESRFFFPSGVAILEDPATGSACANLGGWFCAMRPGARIERVISQGEAVRRPSTLRLAVRDGAIFVGGRVIELGRGTLEP
jgi:PhzF family phenazine biosynthesis protein